MVLLKTTSTLRMIFLVISLLSLCLLALIVYYSPVAGPTIPYEKQILGVVFVTICLLGITAGVTPTSCTKFLKIQKSPKDSAVKTVSPDPSESAFEVKGHHPTCGHYTAHVFRIGDKAYCTGCTGLVIGAVLAIIGTFLYFFLELPVPSGFTLFWIGIIGVTVGLLQHSLYNVEKISSKIIRVLVNVFFVIGAFFLLVGVVEITQTLVLEIYLLLSILYWIFTRIMLSKYEHRKVCTRCGDLNCPLSKT